MKKCATKLLKALDAQEGRACPFYPLLQCQLPPEPFYMSLQHLST